MKQRILSIFTFLALGFYAISPAFAADTADINTGLPLPRFVSLKENVARMRTGPDLRYPIKWIYKKKGAPLKIILEMDNWRKVKDWEGSEGWISRTLLSSKRTMRISGVTRELRSMADEKAPIVAYVEAGVFGTIEKCPKSIDYCKVTVGKYTGWLPRNAFWGLLPNEEIE